MGILRTNTISGIGSTDAGTTFQGVTKFDTQGYVTPPVGVTSDRTYVGVTTAQGAIRFNTDSQKLEFYAQDQWWEMVIDSPNLGVAANTTAGARGVFGGGYGTSVDINVIQYLTISSTGNTIDFGDLSAVLSGCGGGQSSSSTRGLIMTGGAKLNIDYITISSTGDAVNFGNSTISDGTYSAALSNSTRGIQAGGGTGGFPAPATNIIEYVTIASTSNAIDFGDLTTARLRVCAVSSPTRGIFMGGQSDVPGATRYNIIDFITIATLGNTQDFGDLTSLRNTGGSCSNATRGLYFGGNAGPSPSPSTNTIDYITIATLGNAADFGDLTNTSNSGTAVSSSTRGVYTLGVAGGTDVNTIEYVTIQTQGNSVDFGDLLQARARHSSTCSNAHGGL